MPVTTPPVVIVATAGVALLQVPPGVVLAKVVVDPAQTLVVPVMAFGIGLSVTVNGVARLTFAGVPDARTWIVALYVPTAAAPGTVSMIGVAGNAVQVETSTKPAVFAAAL